MRCKELLKAYFTNFSVKVVYDIITSCKICILAAYVFYCVMMYVNFVPTELQVTGVVRVAYSLFFALAATIVTMPAFFIVMVLLGVAMRFAKDICAGGCCLAGLLRKRGEH